MTEEQLIAESRITRWQLQDIFKLFEGISAEKGGDLSLNDIAFMVQKISKGYSYEYEDLQIILQNTNAHIKGAISRKEFLTSNFLI